MRIIGQCKKYAKPIGTSYLQQFDGTLAKLEPSLKPPQKGPANAAVTDGELGIMMEKESIIGILVSGSGFSTAAARYFMNGVSCWARLTTIVLIIPRNIP